MEITIDKDKVRSIFNKWYKLYDKEVEVSEFSHEELVDEATDYFMSQASKDEAE